MISFHRALHYHFRLSFYIETIIERLLVDYVRYFSSLSLLVVSLWLLITDSVLFTTLLWRRMEAGKVERDKKWWKRYSPNSNEVTNCWLATARSMRKMCTMHDLLVDILDAILVPSTFRRICSKRAI